MKSSCDDRHGVYYNNMPYALQACKANYLLMLLDDLQVVRAFGEQDLNHLHEVFEANPRVAFISPLFMNGGKRDYFK